MIKYIYLFLATVFALISPLQAIPSYKLIDIGLSDAEESYASDINDKNQVVGLFFKNGRIYFFLWEEKQGVSLLDLPSNVRPKIINNAGQIAGQYYENSQTRGFLWDPQVGFLDLGTLGGTQTFVNGMNDIGDVVGSSFTNNDAEQHAFLWQNGVMIDLGVLNNVEGKCGKFSEAMSINNQRQIIGNATRSIRFKNQLVQSNKRAVFWRNMKIEELDSNFEGLMHVGSINNKGLLVYLKNPRDINLPRGIYIMDFNSRRETFLNDGGMGGIPSIEDNGNLFFGKGVMFAPSKKSKRKSYEKLNLHTLFRQIAHEPWNDINQANGMNNKNWLVGSATDILGKSHAVILVPLSDK